MSLEKVTEIIAKVAHCDPEDIKPESELQALGLASLDTLTVLFEFEEAFDVEIPNEIIASIVTVQDILDKLDSTNQYA